MYQMLGGATLKSGQEMEIGVVVAPDDEHAAEIKAFLAHKPPPYDWHIELAVDKRLDDLETYFYVGKLGDRVITNVMTVEHVGVGILGHVYTKPEHRRKGAYDALMGYQMEDFRQRGGRALYLETGFDSPPYHIYRRHGFQSVFPRSGFMSYFAEPDFSHTYFERRPAAAREVRWSDGGPMTALTGVLDGEWLRCVRFRMYGPTNFEGGAIALRQRLDKGELDARVLVTEDGARVGFAILGPDPVWNGVHLLDVFCHPAFRDDADALIQALPPRSGRTLCYADESSEAKIAALERAGFRVEGRMRRHVRRTLRPEWSPSPERDVMFDDSATDNTLLDVLVLARG
jgi:GNAT superfamily N-acetyltransferase